MALNELPWATINNLLPDFIILHNYPYHKGKTLYTVNFRL